MAANYRQSTFMTDVSAQNGLHVVSYNFIEKQ